MNICTIRALFYVDLNISPIGQVYVVILDHLIRHTSKSTPHIALFWTIKSNIDIIVS